MHAPSPRALVTTWFLCLAGCLGAVSGEEQLDAWGDDEVPHGDDLGGGDDLEGESDPDATQDNDGTDENGPTDGDPPAGDGDDAADDDGDTGDDDNEPPVLGTRIACVGDSITEGYGLTEATYPQRLKTLLGSAYDVGNFGRGGTTLRKGSSTPYWYTDEFYASADFEPTTVIIMLGSNDAKPFNWDPDDYVDDYADLIAYYRDLDAFVFIATPAPAYGQGAFDISPAIVEVVVTKVWEVASYNDAPVIDINTALSGKSELFPDLIHPNNSGAQLIAETVHAALVP